MSEADVDPQTGQPVGPVVDTGEAKRPGPVVLEGRFGRIEKLDALRHGADLWEAVKGHDALWTYMGYGPFAGVTTFLSWLATRDRIDDPYAYAVIDADGRAVGIVTLMEIRPAARVAEVGNIVYAPALQRTALATEAQYLLARYAFETLGYRRYEWKCNALNAASRRAAERFGFTFEGVFRHHMIVKGRNRDTAWFSMLEREWPARKAAFERWLDPANFDADGRQKVALGVFNAPALAAGERTLRRASLVDRPMLDMLERAIAGGEAGHAAAPASDREDLFHRAEVWVLDGDSGLDAALVLAPGKNELLIEQLAVAPAARRAGLGGALLAAAEARSRALKVSALLAAVDETQERTIAWCRGKGFEAERPENRRGRRVVPLRKTLSP